MLTALEQHFLVHHVYVPSAAHWLDGDHHSMQGGAGPDRACWMTDSKGVNYSLCASRKLVVQPFALVSHSGRVSPGIVTWAAIRDHMAHQPASLVAELHDALAASRAEARRNWDARH